MNPLFKLFRIDKSFSIFDKDVGKFGWSLACKKLIDELGIVIDLDLKNLPKNGPVLIYSNHPTGLDPYLLTAVVGRNDSYFWGDIYQSKKGKNISGKIILVAPRPFSTIIFRPLTNWPGYIYMRTTTPSKSKEETKKINKNAVVNTLELLKNEHQVIILPSGGQYEFLSWKIGLAKIILESRNKGIPLNLYRIKINNFSEFKLIFHFLSDKKFFRKLKIVGYPVVIKNNWYQMNSIKLTNILKNL